MAMAHGSNGAGGGASFMMPPAPGDGIFGMPQAPGEPPILDQRVPMLAAPPEHRTPAPGPPPETVDYEGGGIFSASTPGPADEGLEEIEERNKTKGYDFNPEAVRGMSSPMTDPSFLGSGTRLAPMMFSAPSGMAMAPTAGPDTIRGDAFGEDVGGGTIGLTVVAVAGGAAAGMYYGGAWGALAGSLFGGAAVSTIRALKHVKDGTESSDKEAITSGTYAVGAAAIGGVIWAKLVQPGAGYVKNKPKREIKATDVVKNPDSCDIRPVGP